MEEEEEEFNRWQCWQPVDGWQWQPGSELAGGAPDLLLSEKDLQPGGRVEFESMEAARDAIKSFCWSKSYHFYVRQSDPK